MNLFFDDLNRLESLFMKRLIKLPDILKKDLVKGTCIKLIHKKVQNVVKQMWIRSY